MDQRRAHHEPASSEDATDSAYDQYLEAASRGTAEPPAEFCRQRGITDPEVRSLIEAIHASATSGAAMHVSVLDDFELIRRLGEGAMGIVHLARQRSLDRLVALKVIRPEVARSARAAERFEREARAIARLRHPGIVTVHAVGQAKGVRYIAMELIEGRGLDRVIADARSRGSCIPPAAALGWLVEIADALAFAHDHGIVHRDVKPSNIIVAADGRPLLLDFGVARDLESDAATLTETFVGSPFYIAPEQVGRTGRAIDGRADVYSLGVVLYECVTGRTAFESGTLEQVLGDIISHDPPAPRMINRALTRDLETVIVQAMHKDPARRYASAAAFREDLRALLEYRPIAARPPSRIHRVRQWSRRRPATATGLVAAALGLVGLVAFMFASSWLQQRRVRDEIAATLRDATALVDEQSAAVDALGGTLRQLASLRVAVFSEYLPDDQLALLEQTEHGVARYRVARDDRYHKVLTLLDHAESLGADRERTAPTRTRLYLTMHRAAVLDSDAGAMATYSTLAQQSDPDGSGVEQRTMVDFSIDSAPTGAEVYLYRITPLADLDDAAEHRNVVTPWGSTELPWPPGAWALRVVGAAGDLRVGDLVVGIAGQEIRGSVLAAETLDRLVEIDGRPIRCLEDLRRQGSGGEAIVVDREGTRRTLPDAASLHWVTPRELAERGGAPALVWTGGALSEMTLPVGLEVRVTAAPVPIGETARIGVTPIERIALDRQEHLVVLRHPGFEDLRLVIPSGDDVDQSVTLLPVGTTPPGFVYVPPNERVAQGFWIMEHEVTVGEYDEFLNDPETLATINAAEEPKFVPRFIQGGVYYERGSDGRYEPPAGYTPQHPAFGVSWYDAIAYAAWMTRRAEERGLPYRYDLPSQSQWLAAGAVAHLYPYGEGFRPRWFSSCFTRPTPAAEPVMSFPIDQSLLGVYDMTGSMTEWLIDTWSERTEQKFVKGGSWAHGGPEDRFRLPGGSGVLPTFTDGTTGFRLVLRIGAAP